MQQDDVPVGEVIFRGKAVWRINEKPSQEHCKGRYSVVSRQAEGIPVALAPADEVHGRDSKQQDEGVERQQVARK